jgi:predicted PurR-regulated permease PerM
MSDVADAEPAKPRTAQAGTIQAGTAEAGTAQAGTAGPGAAEAHAVRSVRPGKGNGPDEVDSETRQARQVMADANFRTRDVTLVILTCLAVLYTLYFAASIILPFVLALVLGLLLGPPVEFLNRRLKIPRMAASLGAILMLFSIIGGIGYAISVPASGWIAKAPQSLPVLEAKLSFLRRPIAMVQGGMAQMDKLMHEGQQAAPQAAPGAPHDQVVTVNSGGSGVGMGVGLSVLTGTRAFLSQIFTLMIVLFFLLADGDSLLRRFVEILPGLQEKKRAVQIATEVERNISGYLVTITLMNLLVGTANGLSVWAFGLPDPLLWGTVAFLLNYIPILGPLSGMVIFFFVGLFSFTSVAWAFAPAGVYLLIHLMEGETITPMLLARRFTLNPLLVIVSLMFWDWLWGITGALLAVPLLAVTKILCDHIEALTPLGHLLGAEPPHLTAQAQAARAARCPPAPGANPAAPAPAPGGRAG